MQPQPKLEESSTVNNTTEEKSSQEYTTDGNSMNQVKKEALNETRSINNNCCSSKVAFIGRLPMRFLAFSGVSAVFATIIVDLMLFGADFVPAVLL